MEAPTASEAARNAEPAAQQGDDIYIGFAKGDYAPRAGRKGRFIKDDPRKYPAKEDLGFFAGATGGCRSMGAVGLAPLPGNQHKQLCSFACTGGARQQLHGDHV